MPYNDTGLPHAGSAEQLASMMYDEPAGTLARTIPRRIITSASIAAYNTTGQISVNAVPLPAGLPVTNLAVVFGSTAAVGPSHFWLALLDVQLNVLAVTPDQLAAAQANAALMKLGVTAPIVIPQSGLYYVAASSSAATTAPTAAGNLLAGGIPGLVPVFSGVAGSSATPPAVGSQVNSGNITAGVNSSFAAWIS